MCPCGDYDIPELPSKEVLRLQKVYEHADARARFIGGKDPRVAVYSASQALCSRVHFEVSAVPLAQSQGWPKVYNLEPFADRAWLLARQLCCYLHEPTSALAWRNLEEGDITLDDIVTACRRTLDHSDAEYLSRPGLCGPFSEQS